MRWFKNALLVLTTLLLVAAGALMPGIAGYMQDSYGANIQESRSFDSFRLTLRQDSETARLLRRLAGGNYWMEEAVDWSEQTVQPVHTPQQAEQAALEVLERMVKCGVLDAGVLEELGTPKAAASILKTDANLSALDKKYYEDANAQVSLGMDPETEIETIAIVWDFWWPKGSGYVGPMVRIDDATETVLLAMVPTPCDGKSINLDAQIECWQMFLADHYGFAVMSLEEHYYRNGDAGYIFSLDPEDGEGELRMEVDINTFDDGEQVSQLWLVLNHDN